MSDETWTTPYPGMPRVDVHTHMGGDAGTMANHLRLRRRLVETWGADVGVWVDLGCGSEPAAGVEAEGGTDVDLAAVERLSERRVLCCIHDYRPHTGLRHRPEKLHQWIERGYLGYKIWAGPPARGLPPGQPGHPYIDDPAHEPVFAAMERRGIVAASIHVADPNGPYGNRGQWLPDPVEYWRNISAWRHVLERHPRLQAVTAHMSWLCCQDAQLDYLRGLLATFPGLSVDLAATFQYYHLVDRDNLRDFMVEYADRLLFGTDLVELRPEQVDLYADRYAQCFAILETDHLVPGGFFSQHPTRGLALPPEVLERIYYRNAARRYPRLAQRLGELGYVV